jgi:hypothetical protein
VALARHSNRKEHDMLSNDQMTANRFARWAKARKTVAAIKRHLSQGHTVYICTATKATKYTAKHVDMFKATRTGAWVQHGRKWANFDYCRIQVFG